MIGFKTLDVGEESMSDCAKLVVVFLTVTVTAFGQTPSTASTGTNGKPQVTTFQHQTLGESFEDFMHISGTNMCASQQPQAAEWCATLKSIDTTGQGVFEASSAGSSGTLIFSGRKLVKVLLSGKAGWAATMAEYIKKYGTPDSQTADSATWTFADGGGIDAHLLPDNVINMTFYSREGKEQLSQTTAQRTATSLPPNESQDIAEAARRVRASQTKKASAASSPAEAVNAAAQTITIKGHSLQEVGQTDCAAERAEQVASNKRSDELRTSRIYSDEDIASSFAQCQLGTFGVSSQSKKGGEFETFFYYQQWKLTSMKFTFLTSVLGNVGQGELLLEDATKKFGKPTGKSEVELQNGYGARWTDTYYVWDIPNGHIEVYIAGHATEGEIWGTIKAQTKESWNKRAEELAKRKNSLD
jgi:hypothetical protein